MVGRLGLGAGLTFVDDCILLVAGVPVILNRISFSGELGYEIYCRPYYLLRLAEAIEDAGADMGFRWYGARALLSMRLEKGWGVWTMEYRPDFDAVDVDGNAFKLSDYRGKVTVIDFWGFW